MTVQPKLRPRSLATGLALAFLAVLFLAGGVPKAAAYTDEEARHIFDILDSDHDGKVTKVEWEANKIDAFFFRSRQHPEDLRLHYEETGLSREFFDRADTAHKGYLTGLDLVDAIRFEEIDTRHRGYFDFQDLVAGLKTISR
jgi:hypothetical protein